MSAAFEQVRPYFLVAATGLLAGGFYLVYFRKEACAPGTACAVPNPKLKRFNRAMLWIATVAVGAFALFPNYAGLLLADTTSPQAVAGLPAVTLDIDGMTCEACAVHVQKALAAVPGVASALVVYADGKARVVIDSASSPSHDALVAAVEKAGYKASVDAEER